MCVVACVCVCVCEQWFSLGWFQLCKSKPNALTPSAVRRGGETERGGGDKKRQPKRERDFCPVNLAVYRPRTVYRDDLNHVFCLLPVWCHLLTSAWIGWLRELLCVCLSTPAAQNILEPVQQAQTGRQTPARQAMNDNIQPIKHRAPCIARGRATSLKSQCGTTVELWFSG